MINIDWKLFLRRRAWVGWYYATYDMKTFNHGSWKFEWNWGAHEATEDFIATPWHNCYIRSYDHD